MGRCPPDLLGQIAQARANLMVQGARRLSFGCGPMVAAWLGDDLSAILGWPEVELSYFVKECEGWSLSPVDGEVDY